MIVVTRILVYSIRVTWSEVGFELKTTCDGVRTQDFECPNLSSNPLYHTPPFRFPGVYAVDGNMGAPIHCYVCVCAGRAGYLKNWGEASGGAQLTCWCHR